MDEQAISDDGSKFVSDAIDFALKWSSKGVRNGRISQTTATICIVVFRAVAAVLSQLSKTTTLNNVEYGANDSSENIVARCDDSVNSAIKCCV